MCKLCFIYVCVISLEVHCVSEWTPAALSASSLDRKCEGTANEPYNSWRNN